MHISYSRFASYLSCPYKHYLGYVERLTPKKPARPLYFGSDFHKLLELRGNKKELKKAKVEIADKFYEMPASWQSELGENYVDDLFSIFLDYNKVYKEAPLPHITEHPFEILLGYYKGEPVYFVGVIDELYLYKKQGKKFIKIGEHKTFNRKPDMNTLTMNTQKCLYAKATQIERGVLPQEVIWDYIKSTPAKEPIWLPKSERFSESKSSEITPYSWARACKERQIDDIEIIEKGEKLYGQNISNFFFRVPQELYPQMIDNVWEGFVYTCKDIAKQGHKNKTKNITRDCQYCSFRDICFSEMSGGDTKYIISKNYQEKEEHKSV